MIKTANDPMDGRQFTWNVLNQMGYTPGDMQQILGDIARNGDLGMMAAQGMGLKGAGTSEHRVEETHHGHGAGHAAELKHQNEDFFEKKQDEQERWQKQQDATQKHFEEQKALEARLAEERRMQEQNTHERPAEDKMNMSLLGLPLAFAGGLFMLDGGAAATKVAGDMMSYKDGLSNTMLVTSNNDGSMLSAARGAMGVSGTPNDFLVTGPNQTMAFTPGLSPVPSSAPKAPSLGGADPRFSTTPGFGTGPSIT